MNKAIISLGSNLGDRLEHFKKAIDYLRVAGCVDLRCSSVYGSEPQGFVSENQFANMVLSCSSALRADELINVLMEIETRMGRQRVGKSYSDRIIDLDLIDVDGMTIQTEELTLPHPRMHVRDFVLIPLAEIDPEWVHPINKSNVFQLIDALADHHSIHLVHAPVC